MIIGPRIEEINTQNHHLWVRLIGGTLYRFHHVKTTPLGRPYMTVRRVDTGVLVHCTCSRTDCPVWAGRSDR